MVQPSHSQIQHTAMSDTECQERATIPEEGIIETDTSPSVTEEPSDENDKEQNAENTIDNDDNNSVIQEGSKEDNSADLSIDRAGEGKEEENVEDNSNKFVVEDSEEEGSDGESSHKDHTEEVVTNELNGEDTVGSKDNEDDESKSEADVEADDIVDGHSREAPEETSEKPTEETIESELIIEPTDAHTPIIDTVGRHTDTVSESAAQQGSKNISLNDESAPESVSEHVQETNRIGSDVSIKEDVLEAGKLPSIAFAAESSAITERKESPIRKAEEQNPYIDINDGGSGSGQAKIENTITMQPYVIPDSDDSASPVEVPEYSDVKELKIPEIPQLPSYHYTIDKAKLEQLKSLTKNFLFGLAVVDFDHTRGPELTNWLDDEVLEAGNESAVSQLAKEKIEYYSKIWPYLAFQALPDGVHMYDETFTQFTLCYDELKKSQVELPFDQFDVVSEVEDEEESSEEVTGSSKQNEENDTSEKFENVELEEGSNNEPIRELAKREVITMEDPNQGIVTLFGCACIRQVETSLLTNMRQDMKRSVVQKSVILITRCPLPIQLKEQLSIVTKSWFEQYDFTDVDILKMLYRNISTTYNSNGYVIKDDNLFELKEESANSESEGSEKVLKESDFYMGLNFQETVHKMRRNLMVIYKCLLLGESRILFFSKDLNALSNVQYCLIGLVSNLILKLSDAGYPLTDDYFRSIRKKADSLKSSDRSSMLKFMGLPLHLFGYGSFFQPYLTLQQLSYINNVNTNSFLVGSSNDIILEHKKEWFDVVVHLDEKDTGLLSTFGYTNNGCRIEILNKSLKDKLSLTWADKKFIDHIVNSVDAHFQERKVEDKNGDGNAEVEYALQDAQLDDVTSAIDGDSRLTSKLKTSSSNSTSVVKKPVSTFNSKTINSNTSMDNESYEGGDDFIRSQFEDYLIGFLSTVKYDTFLQKEKLNNGDDEIKNNLKLDLFENEITKFNGKYAGAFKNSTVYKHWNEITEDELFNFFEPTHVGVNIGKQSRPETDDESVERKPKFGGEVFKSWISKWGQSSAKDQDKMIEEDKPVTNSEACVTDDATNINTESEPSISETKSQTDSKGAINFAATTATVKTGMNGFGRDVGQFFKKLGDNTKYYAQQTHAQTQHQSMSGTAEKVAETEEPISEVGDNDELLEKDVTPELPEATPSEDCSSADKQPPIPARAGSPPVVDVQAGVEKLRGLFAWKK